ncbi:MAG: mannose-1-phosphate guanylyltransferase/mannose-6-phosphate isomerase [Gammaproteobacteria bacterium]
MAKHFLPVIMAGGSGTRLWPLSRQLRPKQFLKLFGDETMLQQTLLRLDGLTYLSPCLICNEEHRFLAAEQLRQLECTDASLILEPEGRNTAPAIALAALHATANNDDPVLLVMAADHRIENIPAFHAAIGKALELVNAGKLVTFGIVPVSPETGYGYIKRGETLAPDCYSVAAFVEKPDSATASAYLASGDYFWNSGMFMFRASDYLNELQAFQPAMLASCRQAYTGCSRDMDFIRVDRDAFLQCPANSIDYAVMEKTQNAAMVSLDAGWSDIGSWSAFMNITDKDADGNSVSGDVLSLDTSESLLYSESRLLATLGVNNMVIIETKDAVLVATRDEVQNVKQLVEQLNVLERTEPINHREVYRPWGHYDSIDNGNGYQVKRITVNPGARLSLQKHHRRAEHWVVVSGTAKVTNGDDVFLLEKNQSTYIPIGQVHCLENPGDEPLELIEIQSGDYLGEDDIVRFDDRYGRS